MRLTLISALLAGTGITGVFGDASISSFPNSFTLSSPFDPIQAAYWTGLPHHRRTPFAVSPDGKSAYLAYLDATLKSVVVQQVDVTTFASVGTSVKIPAFEAAGLVAHDDGFAVMATVAATGTTDLPPNDYKIVKLFRYTGGVQSWATALNGPGVHAADGLTASPDANGDLVFNSKSGLYGAYFVVTAYTGWAAGHFGDSVQYVSTSGAIQNIPQSSTFGCSHNTGIGFEAADEVPYASVCAEDHGAIWLNTDTRTMNGIKIANENVTNGASGEPMGGMSGSYSNLARFPGTTNYVFAWQSRGAINLTPDAWMGTGYTQASPRWLNHNVAIATLSAKNKLTGPAAISTVGAADGDSQVNWITKSTTEDHQNVHVAAITDTLSLVTWETLTSPDCKPVPLGCTGTFRGTSFQVVDSAGKKVGAVVEVKDVTVSGDIERVGVGKVCWPYVGMVWDLSKPKSSGASVSKMGFACASLGGVSVTPSSSASSVVIASSSSSMVVVAPVSSTSSIAPIPTTSIAPPVPAQTSTTSVPPAPAPTTTSLSIPTIQPTPIPTTFIAKSTTTTLITTTAPTPSSTPVVSASNPLPTLPSTIKTITKTTTKTTTSKTTTTKTTTTKKPKTTTTSKVRTTRTRRSKNTAVPASSVTEREAVAGTGVAVVVETKTEWDCPN